MDGLAPAAGGGGAVSVAFDEGHVILIPKDQRPDAGFRIVWGKGEGKAKRPMAPGSYRIRGYAVTRYDAQGTAWRMWASGEGREATVRAGEETRLDLDLDVTLKAKSFTMNGKPAVGGGLAGDVGMGLTLFRDKARIAPRWKVLRGGREVAGGACAYG